MRHSNLYPQPYSDAHRHHPAGGQTLKLHVSVSAMFISFHSKATAVKQNKFLYSYYREEPLIINVNIRIPPAEWADFCGLYKFRF